MIDKVDLLGSLGETVRRRSSTRSSTIDTTGPRGGGRPGGSTTPAKPRSSGRTDIPTAPSTTPQPYDPNRYAATAPSSTLFDSEGNVIQKGVERQVVRGPSYLNMPTAGSRGATQESVDAFKQARQAEFEQRQAQRAYEEYLTGGSDALQAGFGEIGDFLSEYKYPLLGLLALSVGVKLLKEKNKTQDDRPH